MSQFDEVIERRGTCAGKYDGLKLLYGNADLLPMWVADMDFKAPKEVIEAVVKRAEHGVFGYSMFGSFYTDAPINWHEKRNNITYKKDSIFFTQSVLRSLNLAILGLTNEGDSVMISIPTYGPFAKVPAEAKRNWVGSHLRKTGHSYEIDFQDFEETIIKNNVKLYILCNPHNPTARVWTEKEIVTILSICKKHQVLVVSDEIHSDLIMPGQTFIPAMKVAREIDYDQSLMVLTAPTKTFNMAGLQVSYYIVENKELQAKMAEAKAYTHVSDLLNNFSYISLEAAYEHGDSYVDELTAYIYENYQYMSKELEQHCPTVEVTDLQATYLTWLNVNYLNTTEEVLRKTMVEHGLAIQTSQNFFEKDDLCIRVNLACPKESLKKGIAMLVNGINSLA